MWQRLLFLALIPLAGCGPTTPVCPLPPEPIVELSALGSAFCVRDTEGNFHCWGGLSAGEPEGGVAQELELPGEPREVAGYQNYLCGLGSGGEVRCQQGPVEWTYTGLRQPDSIAIGFRGGCALEGRGIGCWDVGPRNGGTFAVWHMPGVEHALEIDFGERACARFESGHVACWDHECRSLECAQFVVGIDDAVDLDVGVFSACAVRRDGGLACWRLSRDWPRARPVAGIEHAREVAVGQDHGCARLESGDVWCFGSNRSGEHGLGTITISAERRQLSDPLVVAPAPTLNGAVHVVANGLRTCAIDADDEVRCWGGGESWATPRLIPGVEGAVAVAVGQGFACATTDGAPRCWGRPSDQSYESDGSLRSRVGATEVRWQPTMGPAGFEVVEGEASAWTPEPSRLADGLLCRLGPRVTCRLRAGVEASLLDEAILASLPDFPEVQEVQVSRNVLCGRTAEGRVVCLGAQRGRRRPSHGRENIFFDPAAQPRTIIAEPLGEPVTSERVHAAYELTGLETPATMLAGRYSELCALLESGEVTCHRTSARMTRWRPVEGIAGATDLSLGSAGLCAATSHGVFCRGGVANRPSFPMYLPAVEIAGLSDVSDISVGTSSACALSHGQVRCFGRNDRGTLGPLGSLEPTLVEWRPPEP